MADLRFNSKDLPRLWNCGGDVSALVMICWFAIVAGGRIVSGENDIGGIAGGDVKVNQSLRSWVFGVI